MKIIRAAIAGLLSSAGMVAIASATSTAAAGDLGSVSATTMRSCPDTRCGAVANVPATNVPVSCWRDGVGRWFRVTYGGTRGWVPATAMWPQPAVPYCSDMLPGEVLFAGQSVWADNSAYRLVMQGDGNLVVYGPNGAIWATRTGGAGPNTWP